MPPGNYLMTLYCNFYESLWNWYIENEKFDILKEKLLNLACLKSVPRALVNKIQ